MRKFTLVFIFMLTLCVGHVWGEIATFTNNRSNNSSYSDYTVTSGSGDQEITFTFRSKYYGSGKYYYISAGDNTTLSWTSPADATKTIKITSIVFHGRVYNSGHNMYIKTTFGGETSALLFDDSDWLYKTIDNINNINVMSSEGLVNGQSITFINGDKECQIDNIVVTYEIVSGPLFQIRTGNSDDATAKSAYETQYSTTAAYAADGSNPAWVRNCASILLAENISANYSNYSTKISNLQSYSTLFSQYSAGNTNLDFSGLIYNSDFDKLPGNWNYGWSGTGTDKASVYARQSGNAKFTNNFAEKWVDKKNAFSASGNLYQTITLPRGVYNLKATIVSKNISSRLYVTVPVGDGTSAYIDYKNGENTNERGVIFEVTAASTTVTIGYSNGTTPDNQSGSDTWVAIDDFKLTLVGVGTDLANILTNPDFQNATWDYGWTGTGSDESKAFKNQSGNGNFPGIFAQMWKSGNKLNANGNLYQSVTLPAGLYKLRAKVVSSNIYSSIYAQVGVTDNTDWFTGGGTSAYRAIVFNVPSTSSVQIGYKTRNYESSAASNTWTAVDSFSLVKTGKLTLEISGSNFAAGTIYVDDDIASGFSFVFDDPEVAVPLPTSNPSSDFYYTITTNSLSDIRRTGEHADDVITYDPSTNMIKAWNAGTATITFHHNSTNTVNATERSFTVVVSKIENPITVTLGGVEKNAMNVAWGADDITLGYTSPSNVPFNDVAPRNGNAGVTTLTDGKFVISSSKEGVDYWDISQDENYKYEAGSAYVRIQVNEVAETVSYLYQGLMSDGNKHKISDSAYEIELDYSPLYITYLAWNEGAAIAQKSVCTWYDESDNQLGTKDGSLSETHILKTVDLHKDTRKIRITDSGWGAKYISNVQVVRRTYINASVEDDDLGTVYVGNTETTTLNLAWGTSNGGNITVASNNSRFVPSLSTVSVTADSNGSTSLTITYTPDNANLGTDEATISVHDAYYYAEVTVRATAVNKKNLVYGFGMMYNATRNIQLDDAGTDVYEATYNSGTETVTLNKLDPSPVGNPIIPSGNVVMLYKSDDKTKSSSTIDYEYTATATNLTISGGNCFVHHNGTTPSGCVDYVLKNVGGEVAFYLYSGDAANLNGYNVLRLSTGGGAPSMIRIVTDENNATALVPVYEDKTQTKQINDNRIYTILGVPVRDMSRPGIYIQNGKKYIVH